MRARVADVTRRVAGVVRRERRAVARQPIVRGVALPGRRGRLDGPGGAPAGALGDPRPGFLWRAGERHARDPVARAPDHHRGGRRRGRRERRSRRSVPEGPDAGDRRLAQRRGDVPVRSVPEDARARQEREERARVRASRRGRRRERRVPEQQLVQPRAVGVEQRADRAQSRDAEARGSRAERIRGPRARRVADRVLRERRHGGRQGEGDAQAEAGGGRRQHGEQSGEALRREKK